MKHSRNEAPGFVAPVGVEVLDDLGGTVRQKEENNKVMQLSIVSVIFNPLGKILKTSHNIQVFPVA